MHCKQAGEVVRQLSDWAFTCYQEICRCTRDESRKYVRPAPAVVVTSHLQMGLGRFQLDDDGKKVVAPPITPPDVALKTAIVLPPPDRSASPDLKSANPTGRPISPNILRYAGAAKLSRAVLSSTSHTLHGGVSASASSPTRPLVFVGAVTSSVEVASTSTGRAARRLSNPRLAAETAARAAAGIGAEIAQVGSPDHALNHNISPVAVQPLAAVAEPGQSSAAAGPADRDGAASTASAEGATHDELLSDRHKASGNDRSGAAQPASRTDRTLGTPAGARSPGAAGPLVLSSVEHPDESGPAAWATGSAVRDGDAALQVLFCFVTFILTVAYYVVRS